MRESELHEIKKDLEKVMDFREGPCNLEDSFFGEYKGMSITLLYDGDYSSIWMGAIDNEHKVKQSMTILECIAVKIEGSTIRFRTRDCVVAVGE